MSDPESLPSKIIPPAGNLLGQAPATSKYRRTGLRHADSIVFLCPFSLYSLTDAILPLLSDGHPFSLYSLTDAHSAGPPYAFTTLTTPATGCSSPTGVAAHTVKHKHLFLLALCSRRPAVPTTTLRILLQQDHDHSHLSSPRGSSIHIYNVILAPHCTFAAVYVPEAISKNYSLSLSAVSRDFDSYTHCDSFRPHLVPRALLTARPLHANFTPLAGFRFIYTLSSTGPGVRLAFTNPPRSPDLDPYIYCHPASRNLFVWDARHPHVFRHDDALTALPDLERSAPPPYTSRLKR
ncbi:hypothetical protein DFP72DRAFT_1070318 [Ephemerocybe angulata]|uniref:Uncharacterized protein n=1 Tax=Ephemerocybe angulata TaxID=980116 RepID=A0A8H6M5Q3_9AGAR|nr:hypothetical protein DFP72DRAFT_1070318 [Tulosesus angulatus]